ncbi:hypothetical protein [Zhongshania sp.]|uniref:hypothetical protein n=1 Tax=Zhongshania sp. TaxID=1971902 RepID=UPI0035614717
MVINAEFPEIGKRYLRAANGLVLASALGYSIGFLQPLHLCAYLGPGLGDSVSFHPLIDSLPRRYNEQPLL